MTTKPNPRDAEPRHATPTHAGIGVGIEAGLEAGMEGAARPNAETIRHFKTSEVVDLLDLSRRQLQYWAKTRLVEPSARTPGGHHRYDFNDLVALKATRRLIDAGVSVQKIRRSVGALRDLLPQVGRPLSELVLVATGDVVLVFHDETVFEAITGQEWVFPVAAFEREVSEFRIRQEASARMRHEAEMRLRREADAHVRGESGESGPSDGSGAGRRRSSSRRPPRRAPVQPVERPRQNAGSGTDSDEQRAARPAKPSVRSAKQSRKRWSRTG